MSDRSVEQQSTAVPSKPKTCKGHMSAMHRDACPICNPKTAIERALRNAAAMRTYPTLNGYEQTIVDLADELERLRSDEGTRAHETRVSVAGETMSWTLAQFHVRGQHLLIEEQEKPDCDNALVSFICEAIRLAREYERTMTSPLKASGDVCEHGTPKRMQCPLCPGGSMATFGVCDKCQRLIDSFHNINGCPAVKASTEDRQPFDGPSAAQADAILGRYHYQEHEEHEDD